MTHQSHPFFRLRIRTPHSTLAFSSNTYKTPASIYTRSYTKKLHTYINESTPSLHHPQVSIHYHQSVAHTLTRVHQPRNTNSLPFLNQQPNRFHAVVDALPTRFDLTNTTHNGLSKTIWPRQRQVAHTTCWFSPSEWWCHQGATSATRGSPAIICPDSSRRY